jgi:hypothetical protein
LSRDHLLRNHFDQTDRAAPQETAAQKSAKQLSCERCDVSGNVVSIPPTHHKIHLCMRTDERGQKIIFIKSVFSTNYLKGRRVCNDSPQSSANDVACCALILSYLPAALNVPSERHSRHKG